MLQRDYLERLIAQFFEAVRRSWEVSETEKDPRRAADAIEAAIGEATDIDGSILLSLSPDSMAAILQVSAINDRVAEYLVRGLALESRYLADAGDEALAGLRRSQALALADAYGVGHSAVDDVIAARAESDMLSLFAEEGEEGL